MTELNNNSPMPLYTQLEEILTELIENGTYPQGSRFPTEEELSDQFHVSRVTIRKALQPLAEKGILERKARKGTYVAQKKLTRTLTNVMSFSEMCKAQGLKPGARTLRIDLVPPSREDSELLQLKPESQLLLLERLRYADERPITIERLKFPESFFFLMEEDLTNTSLYDILSKHHIYPMASSKELDIVAASYKESKYLNIARNHPLLRIISLVKTADHLPLHLSEQLCNMDRFKFYV